MEWRIPLFLIFLLILLQTFTVSGQGFLLKHNPFSDHETAENFTKSFVNHVIESNVFGKKGDGNIEQIVKILVGAMDNSTDGETENYARTEAMTMAFASYLAELIVAETINGKGIREKTGAITNALKAAFLETTGHVNRGFLRQVNLFVELFSLESAPKETLGMERVREPSSSGLLGMKNKYLSRSNNQNGETDQNALISLGRSLNSKLSPKSRNSRKGAFRRKNELGSRTRNIGNTERNLTNVKEDMNMLLTGSAPPKNDDKLNRHIDDVILKILSSGGKTGGKSKSSMDSEDFESPSENYDKLESSDKNLSSLKNHSSVSFHRENPPKARGNQNEQFLNRNFQNLKNGKRNSINNESYVLPLSLNESQKKVLEYMYSGKNPFDELPHKGATHNNEIDNTDKQEESDELKDLERESPLSEDMKSVRKGLMLQKMIKNNKRRKLNHNYANTPRSFGVVEKHSNMQSIPISSSKKNLDTENSDDSSEEDTKSGRNTKLKPENISIGYDSYGDNDDKDRGLLGAPATSDVSDELYEFESDELETPLRDEIKSKNGEIMLDMNVDNTPNTKSAKLDSTHALFPNAGNSNYFSKEDNPYFEEYEYIGQGLLLNKFVSGDAVKTLEFMLANNNSNTVEVSMNSTSSKYDVPDEEQRIPDGNVLFSAAAPKPVYKTPYKNSQLHIVPNEHLQTNLKTDEGDSISYETESYEMTENYVLKAPGVDSIEKENNGDTNSKDTNTGEFLTAPSDVNAKNKESVKGFNAEELDGQNIVKELGNIILGNNKDEESNYTNTNDFLSAPAPSDANENNVGNITRRVESGDIIRHNMLTKLKKIILGNNNYTDNDNANNDDFLTASAPSDSNENKKHNIINDTESKEAKSVENILKELLKGIFSNKNGEGSGTLNDSDKLAYFAQFESNANKDGNITNRIESGGITEQNVLRELERIILGNTHDEDYNNRNYDDLLSAPVASDASDTTGKNIEKGTLLEEMIAQNILKDLEIFIFGNKHGQDNDTTDSNHLLTAPAPSETNAGNEDNNVGERNSKEMIEQNKLRELAIIISGNGNGEVNGTKNINDLLSAFSPFDENKNNSDNIGSGINIGGTTAQDMLRELKAIILTNENGDNNDSKNYEDVLTGPTPSKKNPKSKDNMASGISSEVTSEESIQKTGMDILGNKYVKANQNTNSDNLVKASAPLDANRRQKYDTENGIKSEEMTEENVFSEPEITLGDKKYIGELLRASVPSDQSKVSEDSKSYNLTGINITAENILKEITLIEKSINSDYENAKNILSKESSPKYIESGPANVSRRSFNKNEGDIRTLIKSYNISDDLSAPSSSEEETEEYEPQLGIDENIMLYVDDVPIGSKEIIEYLDENGSLENLFEPDSTDDLLKESAPYDDYESNTPTIPNLLSKEARTIKSYETSVRNPSRLDSLFSSSSGIYISTSENTPVNTASTRDSSFSISVENAKSTPGSVSTLNSGNSSSTSLTIPNNLVDLGSKVITSISTSSSTLVSKASKFSELNDTISSARTLVSSGSAPNGVRITSSPLTSIVSTQSKGSEVGGFKSISKSPASLGSLLVTGSVLGDIISFSTSESTFTKTTSADSAVSDRSYITTSSKYIASSASERPEAKESTSFSISSSTPGSTLNKVSAAKSDISNSTLAAISVSKSTEKSVNSRDSSATISPDLSPNSEANSELNKDRVNSKLVTNKVNTDSKHLVASSISSFPVASIKLVSTVSSGSPPIDVSSFTTPVSTFSAGTGLALSSGIHNSNPLTIPDSTVIANSETKSKSSISTSVTTLITTAGGGSELSDHSSFSKLPFTLLSATKAVSDKSGDISISSPVTDSVGSHSTGLEASGESSISLTTGTPVNTVAVDSEPNGGISISTLMTTPLNDFSKSRDISIFKSMTKDANKASAELSAGADSSKSTAAAISVSTLNLGSEANDGTISTLVTTSENTHNSDLVASSRKFISTSKTTPGSPVSENSLASGGSYISSSKTFPTKPDSNIELDENVNAFVDGMREADTHKDNEYSFSSEISEDESDRKRSKEGLSKKLLTTNSEDGSKSFSKSYISVSPNPLLGPSDKNPVDDNDIGTAFMPENFRRNKPDLTENSPLHILVLPDDAKNSPSIRELEKILHKERNSTNLPKPIALSIHDNNTNTSNKDVKDETTIVGYKDTNETDYYYYYYDSSEEAESEYEFAKAITELLETLMEFWEFGNSSSNENFDIKKQNNFSNNKENNDLLVKLLSKDTPGGKDNFLQEAAPSEFISTTEDPHSYSSLRSSDSSLKSNSNIFKSLSKDELSISPKYKEYMESIPNSKYKSIEYDYLMPHLYQSADKSQHLNQEKDISKIQKIVQNNGDMDIDSLVDSLYADDNHPTKSPDANAYKHIPEYYYGPHQVDYANYDQDISPYNNDEKEQGNFLNYNIYDEPYYRYHPSLLNENLQDYNKLLHNNLYDSYDGVLDDDYNNNLYLVVGRSPYPTNQTQHMDGDALKIIPSNNDIFSNYSQPVLEKHKTIQEGVGDKLLQAALPDYSYSMMNPLYYNEMDYPLDNGDPFLIDPLHYSYWMGRPDYIPGDYLLYQDETGMQYNLQNMDGGSSANKKIRNVPNINENHILPSENDGIGKALPGGGNHDGGNFLGAAEPEENNKADITYLDRIPIIIKEIGKALSINNLKIDTPYFFNALSDLFKSMNNQNSPCYNLDVLLIESLLVAMEYMNACYTNSTLQTPDGSNIKNFLDSMGPSFASGDC